MSPKQMAAGHGYKHTGGEGGSEGKDGAKLFYELFIFDNSYTMKNILK